MVIVVALVVAVASAGAALVVRHQTDDVHAHADPMHAQVRALAATERHAVDRLASLRARAGAADAALTQLFAAEQAQVDASNHAVDAANQAVDRFNGAKVASVAAAFQGTDAAISDLEQRTQAVQAAAREAQRAVAALEGDAGG